MDVIAPSGDGFCPACHGDAIYFKQLNEERTDKDIKITRLYHCVCGYRAKVVTNGRNILSCKNPSPQEVESLHAL